MGDRPYTILSCGISLDGYLDAGTPERLVLSNEADLRRVDAVRAESDAILVGAATRFSEELTGGRKRYEAVVRVAPGEPRFQLELAERFGLPTFGSRVLAVVTVPS